MVQVAEILPRHCSTAEGGEGAVGLVMVCFVNVGDTVSHRSLLYHFLSAMLESHDCGHMTVM